MADADDAYGAAVTTREFEHELALIHGLWLEHSERRAGEAACPGVEAPPADGDGSEERSERVG